MVTFQGKGYGQDANYSYFRPFTFGERPVYPFFQKEGKEIGLYELFDVQVEEAERFSELDGNLEDYVVVLFLDCLDKKLKNCIGNDCNEKGTERSFTLRPLLISRSDARDIIYREGELDVPKTEEEIDLHINARYRLPALEMPRFRLKASATTHYSGLYRLYDSLIEGYIPQLQSTLQFAYERFRPILKDTYNSNPFINDGSTNLKERYVSLKRQGPFAIQYFFSMLQDITETYNEFREVAFDLMTECCPAPGRFPKHLRLGHLSFETSCEASPYRTRFTHAPIISSQSILKQRVVSLFKKMVLLPSNFIWPKANKIKITPSMAADRALSERAIPYYYNVFGNNGTAFLKNWNADRLRKCRHLENLSYYSDSYAKSLPHIANPLQYNHEKNGFLRIEGHLGMNYKEALKSLLDIQQQENLPFDIVALKLAEDDSGTTIDFSECHFNDLEIMCQAWRKELECLLSDVVRGVSEVEIDYTLKQGEKGSAIEGKNPFKPYTSMAALTPKPSYTATAKPTYSTYKPVYASFVSNKPSVNPGLLSADLSAIIETEITITDRVKESTRTLKEKTLGEIIEKAIKFVSADGDDYYLRAESWLREEDTKIGDLNKDSLALAFSAPLKVATSAIAFSEKVRGTCSDLDMAQLEASLQKLREAASRYMDLLVDYENETKFFGMPISTGDLDPPVAGSTTTVRKYDAVRVDIAAMTRIVSMLLSGCTLEQLKIIRAEMDLRKAQLRQRNLFAHYISKNPGIEHRGGVPKGGTFVLVYHDISRRHTVSFKGEATLNGRVLDKKGQPLPAIAVLAIGAKRGTLTDIDGSFSLQVRHLPTTLSARIPGMKPVQVEADDPEKTYILKPGMLVIEDAFPAPERLAVIADFYLTYLCCSDCPPVDYVFMPPEGKKFLDLERKSFCVPLEENDPGYVFEVYPAKGVVDGPGVLKSGSIYVFKPTEDLLDGSDQIELSGYKVNGEDMPLSVTLHQRPVVGIVANFEVLESVQNGMMFQLILDNQSSEHAEKFIWEIPNFINEDGTFVENHVIETDDRSTLFINSFFTWDENEYTIKLTATSKHCSGTGEQNIDVIQHVKSNIDSSIETLNNRAINFNVRNQAAMNLAQFPLPNVEDALAKRAIDPNETKTIVTTSGRSLGTIWGQTKNVKKETFLQMRQLAKDAIREVLNDKSIRPSATFNVEDTFSITGRGVVITGRVKIGKVRKGDRLVFEINNKVRIANIKNIEVFRKIVNVATAASGAVGFLISGVSKAELNSVRGKTIEVFGK